MRLLHLADLHLGARFARFEALAQRRGAEQLERFRALPKIAAEHEVDLVLISGDLFDEPAPPSKVRTAAEETFRGLAAGGIPVFVVPGGHDPLSGSGSTLRAGLDAHLFRMPAFGRPITVETRSGAAHLYGVAYDPAREPDPLATFERGDELGPHIVLLHAVLADSPDSQAAPQALIGASLDALRDLDADYLALGGDHRFRPPGELQDLPAAYPGAFAALSPDETGVRGFALVELDADAPPVVRHVPGGVTPVIDAGAIEVDDAADEAEVVAWIVERTGERAVPAATLIGHPRIPLDSEIVRAALVNRFGHAEIDDRTRGDRISAVAAHAREDTMVGHLVRLGRQRIEDAEDADERGRAEAALRIALRSLEAVR